jgi:hypothetical protein
MAQNAGNPCGPNGGSHDKSVLDQVIKILEGKAEGSLPQKVYLKNQH